MLEEDLSEDSPCRKRVKAVAEQVDRLDRITRRYLDVGRPKAVARREAVELNALVEKCLGFLSGEIQASRVEVELKLGEGCVVRGDPDAVSQVVFNLVKNSLEALRGHEGRRLLTLTTRREGAVVHCLVADTGPGIITEVRERLFEPFVTSKPAGHGLGLSVSRQICIDHGGELRVVSAAEASTAFEFSLGAHS
jgi:C4-dicarboxylate-specific signal transduction histidine kinase